MAPSIDPSAWTYTDYVCFLKSHGFHNLSVLDNYLEWGSRARNSPSVRQPEFSRTILLEFSKTNTRASDLSDLNKLRLLLREWTKSDHEPTSPGLGTPSGRIIMVENAAPALIDTLGGLLNIDPAFFAGHLDDSSTTGVIGTSSPQKDFHTIEYSTAFIPVNCPKDIEGIALQCKGNYFRKVELVPKQPRQKVALARRKISFYLRPRKEAEPWLSIVLVDPLPSSFTIEPSSFDGIAPSQQLAILPYQGGYIDFIEMRKPHSKQHHDFRDCQQDLKLMTPFDDLIRHWQIQARDGLFLDNAAPSLPLIMRPCLQLAAAEITNLITYLSHTLAASAPSTLLSTSCNNITFSRALARTITIDTLLSQLKPNLTMTKDFADHSTSHLYRHLLSTLHHQRSVCDANLQHLTALLHVSSTNSITALSAPLSASSTHLRLLLALLLLTLPIFVACAVFSLPATFAPAAHYLYIFLPVVVGIVALVVLCVLPEARERLLCVSMDRICGGLTRRKLLKGERFKRHRETGAKEWVTSPSAEHRHRRDFSGDGGAIERPVTRGSTMGWTGTGTGSMSPREMKRGARQAWDEV